MPERSADSFRQAESDFRQRGMRPTTPIVTGRRSRRTRLRKRRSALFQKLHLDAWGHSVSQLVASLPAAVQPSASLLDRAKRLDKHYIPTRYPNGFDRGAPVDYYTRPEADQAIEDAEPILEFCRRQVHR